MPAILVFAEITDAGPSDRSLKLLAAARALAGEGGTVAAVAATAALPETGLGADQVYWARSGAVANSEICIEAILEADRRMRPDLILLPNSIAGIDAAAPVAIRSGRPLVAYCTELAVEAAKLVARCEMFGGRAVATVEAPLPAVVIATLAAAAEAGAAGASPEVIEMALPEAPAPRIAVAPAAAPAVATVDIAAARRIVAVGRGIGEQDNIELARELADALGAELAASRPLVDLGWVEKERQVGKSGRTVKPGVYLALGISGATEHLEGMRDSAMVIAVNTNPSAPIFEVARWGTTCDLLDLLPPLTEKLRAAKT